MRRDLFSSRPGQAALVALCLALSACGAADESGDLEFDGFSPLTASAEARIGDADDPNVGFSRITAVDVDRNGNLFVVEASGPEIRVYDPAGSLLRQFGREGGGPGEFEGIGPFGVIGDTVWAVDIGARRITLFDRQGQLLSTGATDGVEIPLPAGFGYVLPWQMRPDGKFTGYFASIRYNRNAPPTGVQPTDRIPVPFVLFDASGAVVDTIGWAGRPPPRMWRPPSEEEEGQYQTIQVGGRPMSVPSPPTRLPWWEGLLDGYVIVAAPEPQGDGPPVVTVTRMGLAEDTVFSRAIRYQPIPYTDAELDTIAADAARGGGGMIPMRVGGGAPPVPDDWQAIASRFRAAMRFPESKIPIDRVWVAQDESTWLRLVGRGEMDDWIIIDARGEPRGRLRLPSGLEPEWSRGDVLWAAEPDENDVPWLVRYSIRGG